MRMAARMRRGRQAAGSLLTCLGMSSAAGLAVPWGARVSAVCCVGAMGRGRASGHEN